MRPDSSAAPKPSTNLPCTGQARRPRCEANGSAPESCFGISANTSRSFSSSAVSAFSSLPSAAARAPCSLSSCRARRRAFRARRARFRVSRLGRARVARRFELGRLAADRILHFRKRVQIGAERDRCGRRARAGNSGCTRARARSRRRRSAAAAASAPRCGRAHRPSAAARASASRCDFSAVSSFARSASSASSSLCCAASFSSSACTSLARRRRASISFSRSAGAASPRSPSVCALLLGERLISARTASSFWLRLLLLRRRASDRPRAGAVRERRASASARARRSARRRTIKPRTRPEMWPVISGGCGRPISASTVGAISRSAPCCSVALRPT